MSPRNKLALLCIAVPAVVELAIGVIYFGAAEVMSYHKEVLGVGWADLQPGVRTLLVGLVNAYGSAHFAGGVALAVLLLGPLRRGEAWARWAILAVGVPVVGGMAYVATRLAFATGAATPWPGASALFLSLLVGVALWRPEPRP